MNKPLNLNQIASDIANLIKQGLDIHVFLKKDVVNIWNINVTDPVTLSTVHHSFNVIETRPAPQDKDDERQATAARPAVHKKGDSRWWSRFNFEKNIMKMTLFALQDSFPAEESFPQKVFAARLASMMRWKISTARRHITQAAKMDILNRAVIGTAYHITGINDVKAEAAKDEIADRIEDLHHRASPVEMPLPFDDYDEPGGPASRSALADEGRPLHELELEKAVDESILP